MSRESTAVDVGLGRILKAVADAVVPGTGSAGDAIMTGRSGRAPLVVHIIVDVPGLERDTFWQNGLLVCCCRGGRERGSAPNTVILDDS